MKNGKKSKRKKIRNLLVKRMKQNDKSKSKNKCTIR